MRASILILIVACGLAVVRAAGAQTTGEQVGSRPIQLVMSPMSTSKPPLDSDRLRADLEAELGRPMRLGDAVSPGIDVLTIVYRAAQKELTVGYVPQTGATVVRTLSVAGTVDEITALAVLLAGNIARDQARELLGPTPRPAAVIDDVDPDQSSHDPKAIAAPPASNSIVSSRAPSSTVTLRDDSQSTRLLKDLRIKSVFWTGNLTLMNVGLRISHRSAYALLCASGHAERGRRMAGAGLAVGTRVPVRSMWLQSDVGTTFLYGLDAISPPPQPTIDPDTGLPSESFYTNDRLVTRVRSSLAFSPFRNVEVFAGFAYALTTHLTGAPYNERGPEVFVGVQL